MLELSEYKINSEIYKSPQSVVYRARRTLDNTPVIIKVHNKEYPTPRELAKFKREYKIARSLNFPGVVSPFAIQKTKHALALLMDDFGGISLAEFLNRGRLDIMKFLEIVIRLAEILGEIHRRGVVHKDIKPHNIVFNEESFEIRIIDFGISSLLERENSRQDKEGKLEGTLKYMSPEQTGRLSHLVDHRTDLYSLGITCYELLTGETPFYSKDPRELARLHVLAEPTRPHILKPELNIPTPVSDIIMALLAKDPAERYQSAIGLRRDLESCLSLITRQPPGDLSGFTLQGVTYSERLLFPDKLYGREKELALLMDLFEKAAGGSSALVLIRGQSGIGKTALVERVRRPLQLKEGFFIQGKFEQYDRDVPYFAFIQAFTGLVRQILAESSDVMLYWRNEVTRTLGNNAGVIADIIPELEILIGPQPLPQTLNLEEARNRLELFFLDFIGVFARPHRPLCLFLDDLQWADGASLRLLEALIGDNRGEHFLILGAYRDNEIGPTHALNDMLKSPDYHEKISVIEPKVYAREELVELLCDTFHSDPEDNQEPGAIILSKTHGNPFFVRRLLEKYYRDSSLSFNYERENWDWNIDEIRKADISDNVTDFMVSLMETFPEKTREVCAAAACLGGTFSLEQVCLVSRHTPVEVLEILQPAMQASLILPLDPSYKYLLEELPDATTTMEEQIEFKFLHDRVQQAAYSLLDRSELTRIHFSIGNFWLEKYRAGRLDFNLIEAVNHLNIARDFFKTVDSKIEIAAFNLRAGQKAKNSADFEGAALLFNEGIALLPQNSWNTHYELTRDLFLELAESEYASTRFDKARELFDVLLTNLRTSLERVQVYENRVLLLSREEKHEEAIKLGLIGLKELGVHIPDNLTPEYIDSLTAEFMTLLGNDGFEGILELPPMQDSTSLAVIRLCDSLLIEAYISGPDFVPVFSFIIGINTLKHGLSSDSSTGLLGIGMCLMVHDVESGYNLGKLTVELANRFDNLKVRGKVYLAFSHIVLPYKEHIRNQYPYLENAIGFLRESGALESLGYCIQAVCHMDLYSTGTRNLALIELDYEKYHALLIRAGQEHIIIQQNICRQFLDNLLGKSEDVLRLNGNHFRQDESINLLKESKNYFTLTKLYFHLQFLAYLFGDYQESLRNARLLLEVASPNYTLFTFALFLKSLCLSALYLDEQEEQEEYLTIIKANQEKLKTWAEHCPQNYRHMYELVEAELAWIEGNFERAEEYYELAAEHAREWDYFLVLALSYERAALYYKKSGRKRFFELYFREAYYAYMNWGAIARMRVMEKEYPELLRYFHSPGAISERLPRTISQGSTYTAETHEASTTIIEGGTGATSPDFKVLLEGLRELTRRQNCENLLEIFINLCLKLTNAQRALYFQNLYGEYYLTARAFVGKDDVEIIKPVLLEDVEDVTIPIINFVSRTGESLVLGNAVDDERFSNDPWIQAGQTRSLLCLPVLNEGKLVAILNLENSQTTGAFSATRLELLKFICVQFQAFLEVCDNFKELQDKLETSEAELNDLRRRLDL